MSHRNWQRFQAAGERLATCQPELFQVAVNLLELLADDYALSASNTWLCQLSRRSRSNT